MTTGGSFPGPGPEPEPVSAAALELLEAGVEAVLDLDADRLDHRTLHEAVVKMRRLSSRFDAAEGHLADRWDAVKVWSADGSRSAGARLARDALCAPQSANRLVRRTRKLRSMKATSSAHRAGAVSTDHVDVLCRAYRSPVAQLFARDESLLLGYAHDLTFTDFERAVAYWLQLADDEAAEGRADDHDDQRWFRAAPTLGGVDLQGKLGPVDGEIVRSELHRLEKRFFETDWAEARDRLGDLATESDLLRTTDQRRADALVEMARRSATMPPGAVEARPLISVLVDHPTLVGRVCETFNGTVITPRQVADLLTEADLERVVFDPAGRVIDIGAKRRLFSGATRRAVQIRDRRCQFPGCDRPAEDCQVDHIVEWSVGGPTVQDNGRLLCAAHNRQPPGHQTGHGGFVGRNIASGHRGPGPSRSDTGRTDDSDEPDPHG